MLAGGVDGYDAGFQSLADAEIVDPRRHAPMGMAVRRALGGTSLLWGGRCVAFDDVDFSDRRPGRSAKTEIAPWYDRRDLLSRRGRPGLLAPLAATA